MNKGFLKIVSILLLGAMLPVSARAQNYRVKAERYERGIYSPETNPASVRYAIIDLGPDVEPIRLSNGGHVLCQPAKFGKLQSRWYQGQFQELTGGDDSPLVGTLDMNNAGTVVGGVLEYKTGSAGGLPPCPDSEHGWYRNPSYGIRRAAVWNAGSGAASLLGQPAYGFNIYDCTVPHGPPFMGVTTFGSAWTIDDSGHIYGEAQAAYAEHQSYNPPPDDYYSPTVPAAAYSGFSFGGAGILGDLSLVYDPAHNIYTTQGTSYHVRKVRNGVTMGYDSTGKNLVNSLPVDFVPTTMNSQGLVLGAVIVDPNFFFGGYTKFLIYDPATRIQTDLPMRASRFFGPGQFHPPVALNHRTIAVTNSSGQTIFKESPQIVGPEGAVIWEENPKTGQYFSQSLNLLIPEDSGWYLTSAKAINDNGVIICKGTYQGQPRACLLWPMKTVYVFFGIRALDSQAPLSDALGNHSELDQYLNNTNTSVKWAPGRPDYYPGVVTGAQTGQPYVLAKGVGPKAAFARIYIYDAIDGQSGNSAVIKAAFQKALATEGSFVTFNGHSNMGIGPAFTTNVANLSGFTRLSARGVAAISAPEFSTEGYTFSLRPYVPGDANNEILATGKNYTVTILGIDRFPNIDGVAPDATFQLKGTGSDAYHYTNRSQDFAGAPPETRNYTLVKSGSADLPTLNYKWFYFDGCSSGRDYIENFRHGSFFYTTAAYGNTSSTKLFVQGILEGQNESEVRDAINDNDIDQRFNQFYPFN